MNDCYVYALYREDGSSFYIGKGNGPRWTIHEYRALRGERSQRASVIRRILRAGGSLRKEKLCEGLSEKQAHFLERWFIHTIGRKPSGPLVNLTNGGEGTSGREVAQQQREQTASKLRGRKRGRTLSTVGAARLSEKLTGSKRTPEQRANMSAAQMGNRKGLGKTFSEDRKRKISEANKGRKRSPGMIAQRTAKRRDNTLAKLNWFWKTCCTCAEEKPMTLDFFARFPKAADRFAYECRECARKRDRERYARKVRNMTMHPQE